MGLQEVYTHVLNAPANPMNEVVDAAGGWAAWASSHL